VDAIHTIFHWRDVFKILQTEATISAIHESTQAAQKQGSSLLRRVNG
jgi:hypothetical protein